MNDKPADQVIVDSTEGKYALIPSNSDLTGAEVALLKEIAREVRLRSALETIQDIYDFILIDCPPSLNMLTVNALVAANSVMIPMQCGLTALKYDKSSSGAVAYLALAGEILRREGIAA